MIHIGGVIGWAGSSFLFGSIIGPAMDIMKPNSRADFLIAVLPKFSRFVLLAALVTVGSGVIIGAYVLEVNTSLLPAGIGFLFLVFGALAGFIALLIAIVMIYPFSGKLLKLLVETNGQTNLDGALISRIEEAQRNVSSGGKTVGVLLAIAVILMALSLYV
jgi:uncharacterized membrane protein